MVWVRIHKDVGSSQFQQLLYLATVTNYTVNCVAFVSKVADDNAAQLGVGGTEEYRPVVELGNS